MTKIRRKLIEVSLPLDKINAASKREKSIKRGHPSTLHLWWARRPLAACRAVLFAQLVDDPSSVPDEFPTEAAQEKERQRLFEVIERLVIWENSNNNYVIGDARREIARSVARSLGVTPPVERAEVDEFLATKAPPVCDPFCGGGSIPLEAQRLGLRAHGSDLNPVAVLVSKATCEIPPKFANLAPANSERDLHRNWAGAEGLAEDIRWYGNWMRNEAEKRIGKLYPKVQVTKEMAADRPDLSPYAGKELTVIAWLWARTVASPDPSARGLHVPLASSFVLSSRKGKEAIVVPVVESSGYRFVVKTSGLTPEVLQKAKSGTKAGRGAKFTCLLSGAPISGKHIRRESMAGRMEARLMALVAEGLHGRVFLDPTEVMDDSTKAAQPAWRPGQAMNRDTSNLVSGRGYGFFSWADIFTDRQLVALGTLSGLVSEARERALQDALAAGMEGDGFRLAEGGRGAEAYADAVATYLGLCVSRQANRCSNLNFWDPGGAKIQQVFARQALPMVWDFCEANPFSDSSGNFVGQVGYLAQAVENSPVNATSGTVIQHDAAEDTSLVDRAMIATDPPYYDNIGYADLSDFFYVWQRRTLRYIWPDLFRRLLVPKDEELVATPHRHGGREAAEQFFMQGMERALSNMHVSATDEYPATIYYAFKQSEVAKEGLTSPGWATFLQGLVDVGYLIDGTWPVRTELSGNLKKRMNALASSIVLVCRKRSANAPKITRREFIARLRETLPAALKDVRAGGVGPVDMAQASIGPGMRVFSEVSQVLEADDTAMTVRTAIALINQVRDEISGEEAVGYDPVTRFCINWFESVGIGEGNSGDAITMAQAYGIGLNDLEAAKVIEARGGSARLLRRDEFPHDWDPEQDLDLTVWKCAWCLANLLESPEGGVNAAARIFDRVGTDKAEAAQSLVYRLYDIAEQKDLAAEAQVWNNLAREWQAIADAAPRLRDRLL